ncbi:hypothetical protein BKA62DRAFT_724731, partial [Auriculariales sp. MPI-PUGE-AT-0066]
MVAVVEGASRDEVQPRAELRNFFWRIDWETTVFNEGHVRKNSQSQRYQNLLNRT